MVIPKNSDRDLGNILRALQEADRYIERLEEINDKIVKIFTMIRDQFNNIGINVKMLVIMRTYMIIFQEDFEDIKLFNEFKQLYNPENKTLTLSIEQADQDINLLIMLVDAIYENIERLCDMQYKAGKWDPRKKNEGTA